MDRLPMLGGGEDQQFRFGHANTYQMSGGYVQTGLSLEFGAISPSGLNLTSSIWIVFKTVGLDHSVQRKCKAGSERNETEATPTFRDLGSIPGLGRSPGEGNGNPFQDYCLENPMDRGAWQATVHGVAKSWTRLSNFTSLQGIISGRSFCKVLESIENLLGGKKVKDLGVIDYEGEMRSREAEGYSVLCFFSQK